MIAFITYVQLPASLGDNLHIAAKFFVWSRFASRNVSTSHRYTTKSRNSERIPHPFDDDCYTPWAHHPIRMIWLGAINEEGQLYFSKAVYGGVITRVDSRSLHSCGRSSSVRFCSVREAAARGFKNHKRGVRCLYVHFARRVGFFFFCCSKIYSFSAHRVETCSVNQLARLVAVWDLGLFWSVAELCLTLIKLNNWIPIECLEAFV